MRPERRSSRVSSAILEYIRINWNWNDSLSELLVISQSTPSPRTKTETSQGHFLAWSLLDLEKEERILGISLPQPTSGESQDASWYKHRCPFTWPRNHLPPLWVPWHQRTGWSCSSLKLDLLPLSFEDFPREVSEAPEGMAKEMEGRTWGQLLKIAVYLEWLAGLFKNAEITAVGRRQKTSYSSKYPVYSGRRLNYLGAGEGGERKVY